MKKLIIAICVLFSTSALGATLQAEIEKSTAWFNGQRMYRVKVYIEPDGADLAEFSLKTYLSPPYTDTQGKVHSDDKWSQYLEGGLFRQLETDPGTAPDTTWAVTISSDVGSELLALTGLSITATEMHIVSATLGASPAVYDLLIDLGDIGSDGDEVTLYFYIIK